MNSTASKQALNFLWISIGYPTAEKQAQAGTVQCPIPEQYVANVANTAAANPTVDVHLWVDKKRHTPEELEALSQTLEANLTSNNIQIRDLNEISRYQCRFFASAETSPGWRLDKHSLIWRQVDAAKFLVCFEGHYDQVFFADLDASNIDINSTAMQTPITEHGMVFAYQDLNGQTNLENGFFGFTPTRKHVFKSAYESAYLDSERAQQKNYLDVARNGYEHLLLALNTEFKKMSLTNPAEVGYEVSYLSISAHHPTRANQYGTTLSPASAVKFRRDRY